MKEQKNGIVKIILGVTLVAVIALVIWGGVNYKNKQNSNQTTNTISATTAQPAKSITYQGENGKTVYDILKAKYTVKADQSSYGVLVKSINGLKATDKEFWLYSVNGKSGEVAADKQTTVNSDRITWEYKGF